MPRPSRLLVEYPANRVPLVRAYERRGGTGGRGEPPVNLRAQYKSLADQTDLVVGTARILVQSIDDSCLSEKDRYIVDTLRDRLAVLDVLEGDAE